MMELRHMPDPIRLLIVEDDPCLRTAVVEVFQEAGDIAVLGVFSSAEELLEHDPPPCPDIGILDINLPGMDGVECLRRFSQRCPSAQYLMYTVNDAGGKVFEALKAGASGYVLKTSTPDELVEAVHDLHAGGAPMTSAIAR